MSLEDELASALTTLVVEARELLTDMEAGLLRLESERDDEQAGAETLGAVFRAAHTIKGSAGLFGLEHVVEFTHVVETVLDRVRACEVPVTAELVGALLPCRDHMSDLVEGVADGALTPTDAQDERGVALLETLRPYLAESAAPDEAVPEAGWFTAVEATDERRLHVSLRFGPDSLRAGMDPLAFIRYLSTVVHVADLLTVVDTLPAAQDLDAETCYLGFEVSVRTTQTPDQIAAVFDFVRDDSDIRVLQAGLDLTAFDELLDSYGPAAAQVLAFLEASGAVVPGLLLERDPETPVVLAVPVPPPADTVPTVASLPAPRAADAEPVAVQPVPTAPAAAPGPPAAPVLPKVVAPRAGADPAAREARTLRVDAPRLDRLIDVVGELVIAGAAAGLRASAAGQDALVEALGDVMRLVEEVRDSALQLRMVPIGTTFSRFQRVVRDVAGELGKEVDLHVTGGDTEVDKALVERISDPLLHLVRNSLDHGIESAQHRREAGKPERGTLRLNAFHDSGSIVIEVADDGGGIDRDRVLAKAVERGLVDPGATPTDAEVFALIFEPGFSTAAEVSNLSGRGVGMDVVKRNVGALRGTIDVESSPGRGTTTRIRLPLTLAIIDGFLVGVGGASFVVPLDRVVECVELPPTPTGRDCMDLRGQVLPCVRLRSIFPVEGGPARRESVVVVEYAGSRTGLVVDSLGGEFQTVIKPLGPLFEHVPGVGGATILGNGEVALIIDVPALVCFHAARQPVAPAHP